MQIPSRTLNLLLVFAFLICATTAMAQPRVPVVGILMAATPPDDVLIQSLRDGLKELGYTDGQNIKLEYRGAFGRPERLPELAQELVDLKVDVIIVATSASIRAARAATSTIPILAVFFDEDPVVSGLVSSLNHPGGNITGVQQRQLELAAKRLELLKEALPSVSRVAVFWDKWGPRELAEFKPAARALGLQLDLIELRAPYDFSAAYRTARHHKAGAVVLSFSTIFYTERVRLGSLGFENRLPVVGQLRDTTEAGGFLSYGHEFRDTWFRFAYFIDRLIKGVKPGDIPIEEVSTFKLVVNARTAKSLGLTVSPSVLLRADEVIK
jgi:putative ABC transport system substrate-binding protein